MLLEWDGFDVDGPADGHLGLGFDIALDAVRTDAVDAAELDPLVRRLRDDRHADARPLLPPAADPYFRAWAVDGTGAADHRPGGVLRRRRHRRRGHAALGRTAARRSPAAMPSSCPTPPDR